MSKSDNANDPKYVACNIDAALGKFSVIMEIKGNLNAPDSYTDAGAVARAELGAGATRVVDGSMRTLSEIPADAWESKHGKGWAWLLKGHFPVNDLVVSITPQDQVVKPDVAVTYSTVGVPHNGLREYASLPELVDGWVTDQAVVLKDGVMKSTQYWQKSTGGLFLRSSFGPEHGESEQGLLARFAGGERFYALTDTQADIANRIIARDSARGISEYNQVVRAIAMPDVMEKWVFEEFHGLAESMDRAYAAGRDAVTGFDERHAEVARVLDAAPYQMHPDYGCVLNADVARLDELANIESDNRNSAAAAIAKLQVLESIKLHFEEAASAWSSLPAADRKRQPFAPSSEAALEGSITHGLKAVTALVDDLLVESTKDANAIPDPSA